MRQNEGNQDLRQMAAEHGIYLWQIAESIGIGDATMTRWMRRDFPPGDPRRERILQAITDLLEGDDDGTQAEMDGATV